MLSPWKESYDKPSRDITLPTKVRPVKAMVFPVVMYGCESWTIKKAEHWRTDAFKLFSWTLESPMDSKEIKPVNPKGNQAWIFIGRTDAETPKLWPLDAKGQLIRKDLDDGKDWGQKEKGATEDEMSGWHRDSVHMNLGKLQETVKDRKAWWAAVNWAAKSQTEWLNTDSTCEVFLNHLFFSWKITISLKSISGFIDLPLNHRTLSTHSLVFSFVSLSVSIVIPDTPDTLFHCVHTENMFSFDLLFKSSNTGSTKIVYLD